MSVMDQRERRFSLLGAALMPFAVQAVFILIRMSGEAGFFPGGEPSWALASASCGVILLLQGIVRYRGVLASLYVPVMFFLLMGFSGLFMALFYGIQSTPVY